MDGDLRRGARTRGERPLRAGRAKSWARYARSRTALTREESRRDEGERAVVAQRGSEEEAEDAEGGCGAEGDEKGVV